MIIYEKQPACHNREVKGSHYTRDTAGLVLPQIINDLFYSHDNDLFLSLISTISKEIQSGEKKIHFLFYW